MPPVPGQSLDNTDSADENDAGAVQGVSFLRVVLRPVKGYNARDVTRRLSMMQRTREMGALCLVLSLLVSRAAAEQITRGDAGNHHPAKKGAVETGLSCHLAVSRLGILLGRLARGLSERITPI